MICGRKELHWNCAKSIDGGIEKLILEMFPKAL
jgi:hypothetical protein